MDFSATFVQFISFVKNILIDRLYTFVILHYPQVCRFSLHKLQALYAKGYQNRLISVISLTPSNVLDVLRFLPQFHDQFSAIINNTRDKVCA